MTERAISIAGLALTLLAAPLAVLAQGSPAPRVGILAPGSCGSRSYQALRRGLEELGYTEGRTIVIECREAAGRSDRLPGLARELVDLGVDVLVTDGTAGTRAALHATQVIPIVMGTVGDPLRSGFVTSLARPGGNRTGLSLMSGELNVKRLELLREIAPGASRVAVLANPENPTVPGTVRELEDAARRLGVTLQVVEVRWPGDAETASSTLVRARAGAILVLPDPVFFGERQRIASIVSSTRLPAVYEAREFAEAGGLLGYGPDIRANFHRAAAYVDRILKGASPGDLPVEQPRRFEIVINLRTAKALGLRIPPSVLARADEVIE